MRQQLVETALAWEKLYGNAPAITCTLSEYDAAKLLGLSDDAYSELMQDATAVQKGYDFCAHGVRYQVKGNRPSGKPGSRVTKVPKASNYDWDTLIWILYDKNYELEEAWLWSVEDYRAAFDGVKRLSPQHYRQGIRLH
jgi:hypothetical protein